MHSIPARVNGVEHQGHAPGGEWDVLSLEDGIRPQGAERAWWHETRHYCASGVYHNHRGLLVRMRLDGVEHGLVNIPVVR